MSRQYRHIACLGSSFAAGPGIPPLADAKARRSGKNFAHQVAEQLQCKLTDLSVSGSTTTNITSEAHAIASGLPPQIEGLPSDCDLVLVTTGGNDIGYIKDVTFAAIRATWFGWFLSLILSLLPLPKAEPLTQDQLAQRLGDVLDAVHAKAPQARVLMVEYVALFGDDTTYAEETIGMKKQDIELGKQRADLLRRAYAQACQEGGRSSWSETVEMHDVSKAHAIGSQPAEEAWVTGFSFYDATILKQAPFHPTLKGMTATTKRIVEHLQ